MLTYTLPDILQCEAVCPGNEMWGGEGGAVGEMVQQVMGKIVLERGSEQNLSTAKWNFILPAV